MGNGAIYRDSIERTTALDGRSGDMTTTEDTQSWATSPRSPPHRANQPLRTYKLYGEAGMVLTSDARLKAGSSDAIRAMRPDMDWLDQHPLSLATASQICVPDSAAHSFGRS
jgi:hypothetical protein